MKKLLCLALLASVLAPRASHALELKNVRVSYGPFGAVRTDLKVLPGDYLFMTYDIEGLTFDKKTGKASYVSTLELLDSQNKVVFKRDTPNEFVPQLGGARIPGDLNIQTGAKQAPGKYNIKLSVEDRVAKETKSFTYEFVVQPVSFGIIGVIAPGIGFPGQSYLAQFHIAHMNLDAKKLPNVDVAMRVLDADGKQVTPPAFIALPKDMPEGIDLTKENLVPLSYPLYLNRSGRFQIELSAQDKNGKVVSQIRYPLVVIDITAISGK